MRLRIEYFVIRWHSVAWQRRRRSGRPPRFPWRPTVAGSHYAVSSGHYLATAAAMRVLDAGGNAVDAGVTATMALSVLRPDIGFLRRRCADAGLPQSRKPRDLARGPRLLAGGNRCRPAARRRRQGRARGNPAPGASRRAGDAHRGAAALRPLSFEQAVTPAYQLARDGFYVVPGAARLAEIPPPRSIDIKRTPPSSVRRPHLRGGRPAQAGQSRAHPRRMIEAKPQGTGRPRGETARRARLGYKGSIADDRRLHRTRGLHDQGRPRGI